MKSGVQHRWPKVSRERVKEVPRKAYWQTREAFRNSVSSLRRDSVDAPSLFGDGDRDGDDGVAGAASRRGSVGGGTRKGSLTSLGSLRRKLSLRGGGVR